MTYVIVVSREFYGPATRKSLYLRDDGQSARKFATRDAAKAFISDLDGETYHLAHNESGRASYKIARIDALPAYLADQV
jgi:hypothetical protein